ncbi:cilia- and flagella-associated protein 276 isoform X2 [Peromyscus maniculatus bairdii]|uniref:cilia- and flagella-associated protein 276 isoform X2 n=1 Tax=Peromyscus maniculatus bairdii TaxID=230844 RepID=UPI001C2E00E3|nr:protein C1orf194 homolog isoform X2 [Peromyscus maniculatus bairdii]
MPHSQESFSHPTLSEEDSHLGSLRASKKSSFKNPTHLAQQQEPWSRLNSTPTFTSMRRDACFFDPKMPKDDLDFRLAALYDHHTGAFKNKTEILLHQETIQDKHGSSFLENVSTPLRPPSLPGLTSSDTGSTLRKNPSTASRDP